MQHSFNLKDIQDDALFSDDVLVDENFFVAAAKTPLTKSASEILQKWGINAVFSDGSPCDSDDNSVPDEKSAQPPNKNVGESIFAKAIENAAAKAENAHLDEDATKMLCAKMVYDECKKRIEDIFTAFSVEKKIPFGEIVPLAHDFCLFTVKNKRFLLRLATDSNQTDEETVLNHSVRTAILSISMGLTLRLPTANLIELTIASFFHEIGMLQFSKQVYTQTTKLSDSEKRSISSHPLLSYNILRNSNFPTGICVAVLEHHERENGQGYPRHLEGGQISPFAKIISVACAFEAITATRPYQNRRELNEGVVELLQNASSQFDKKIIAAALKCFSLYPIGTYVELSNGLRGIVTDISPDNPKTPVVQVLDRKTEDGKPFEIDTMFSKVKVARPLTRREVENIRG